MRIAVTGHRPDKLGVGKQGYSAAYRYRLLLCAKAAVGRFPAAEHWITGMALGWDQAVAQACVDLGVPFVAAVPFEGQESRWHEDAREYYRWLLERAKEVRFVCDPGYAAWKMHRRNEWMVDNSDLLVALYDGGPDGGTASCVAYARKRGRTVANVWRSWQDKYSKGE